MRFLTAPVRKTCYDEKLSFVQVRALLILALLCLSVLGLLAAPVPSGRPGNYPAWWFSRGVIGQNDTNSPPTWPTDYPNADDYAAINQGQLMNIATAAYTELQASAPTNVWTTTNGTNLTYMVNQWSTASTNSYNVVNLGQLKAVAASFYNVLIQIGYTNNVPWSGLGADDYAVANIGQTKNAFSFDVGLDSDSNGLPDWWEMKYFGHIGNNASSSPDGNGITLSQDYQQGNNPTNYYSQNGGTITPTLTITGGNNQIQSHNTFVPQALAVTIQDSHGNPLTNAPVTFSIVTPSDAQVAPWVNGHGAPSLVANTDSTGTAHVSYIGASTDNTTNSVQATAASASVTFTETTDRNDGDLVAPSGLTVTPGTTRGQMVLTWTNNAPSATFIEIKQSTDNVNWVTVATINDPTVSTYTVNETDPTISYYFAIIAGKP